jgi:hypothetical protein
MYSMNDVAETLAGASVQKSQKKNGPHRQLKLSPSFSSVHDLMPGRKPFAKGKKRSTERGHSAAKSKGKSEAA